MSARISSLAAGSSHDPAVNSLIDFAKNGFGDTQMFGLLARRPELLKRIASVFAYFLAGEGGLIEPRLLELMRVRGAHLNACTYCATVRLQPVATEVKAKDAALGVCDISGMTKSQAVTKLRDKFIASEFTPMETLLVRRNVMRCRHIQRPVCSNWATLPWEMRRITRRMPFSRRRSKQLCILCGSTASHFACAETLPSSGI